MACWDGDGKVLDETRSEYVHGQVDVCECQEIWYRDHGILTELCRVELGAGGGLVG